MRTSRSPRRIIVVALLIGGTALIQLAWILSVSPFRGIDEFDHAYRAASVAHGNVVSPGYSSEGLEAWGTLIAVPPDIVRAASAVCETYDYVSEANCHPVRRLPTGLVLVASGAANYNPAFYVVVGWPSLLLTGADALYGMRAVAGLLCLAFVGLAAWAVSLWARTIWPLVGLLVAMTPMALYSFSIPSPNGVEMASALCLWVSLLGVTRAVDARHQRALIWIACAATLPLVVTRLLGPLWWGLIVATCLLCGTRSRWVAAWNRARLPSTTFVVISAVSIGFGVWWSLSLTPNPIGPSPSLAVEDPADLRSLPLFLAHATLWILQSIAAFPTRNDYAPLFVYITEVMLLAGWLGVALKFAAARLKLVLALVIAASIVVPVAATLRTYQVIGFVWQGRYTLPLAFGVVLVAATALDDARCRHRLFKAAGAALAVIVVLAHVASLVTVLEKETRLSPLAGDPGWLQPQPWLVIVLSTAGLVAWGLSVARSATPARVDPGPSHDIEDEVSTRSR